MTDGAIVVGAGLMGSWHSYYLRKLNIPVIAIVDPEISRATKLARKSPGCQPYGSLDLALKAVRPATIHLCADLEARRTLMPAALASGADLLIEKPIASSLSEYEAWQAEAARRGARLVPCHQFAWQRGFRHAQKHQSRVGPLVGLRHLVHTAGGDLLETQHRKKLSLSILPHSLSLFQGWWGIRLGSILWEHAWRTKDSLLVTGIGSGVRFQSEVCLQSRPTRNELWVTGTEGSYRVDLFHGFSTFTKGKVSRWHKATLPLRESYSTAVEASKNLFIRALQGEVAYPGLEALIRQFYGSHGKGSKTSRETAEICAALDTLRELLESSGEGI